MTIADQKIGDAAENRGPAGHDILFPKLPYDLRARADRSARDIRLQQFISRFTNEKSQARKGALAQAFGSGTEAMRDLAAEIKQHTLDHLDYYLDQFIDNAKKTGTTVHFAKDGDQANAIAVAIARNHRCRLCVKSKSMVTEETRLVPQLQAAGCETIETDLGEFIIQLDHDAPSHIVAPMIHKDKAAVARVFERELGAEYNEDPEQLTQIARRYLRQKYRQADLGVTGGNFLVAESGSIVLCTNEGNGRFCTSAPKIHVALVGIEKLVPGFEHLAVLLKLLSRSSTGQVLTCYTQIITGPKRAHEHDGPEQLHLILLDNGRTEVLRPETRAILRCIRCGACLNVCPVYRKIGGHAYGSVYSGPIGAILTPLIRGLANYPDLPHASSLCGACSEVCPVKIDIPRFLIQLRHEMVQRKFTTLADRLLYRVWSMSLRHGLTYRMGGWTQKTILRGLARLTGTLHRGDPYVDRGWLDRGPGPLGGWTSQRDMPTPPARSFRHWWARQRGRRDKAT